MGEFGYILFLNVESDVLKSFGSDNIFMNFVCIGMVLVFFVIFVIIWIVCKYNCSIEILMGRIVYFVEWKCILK